MLALNDRFCYVAIPTACGFSHTLISLHSTPNGNIDSGKMGEPNATEHKLLMDLQDFSCYASQSFLGTTC